MHCCVFTSPVCRKSARLVCILVLLLSTGLTSLYAFRCGRELVDIGDHAAEVRAKCGEPMSREMIGYTLTLDQERELKITEWVYETQRDQLYVLTFEGNRLVEIEYIRK